MEERKLKKGTINWKKQQKGMDGRGVRHVGEGEEGREEFISTGHLT